MSRFNLNLSGRRFPRYRATNMMLTGVLVLILGFSAWQVTGFQDYTAQVSELNRREQDLRVESEYLGGRIEELDERLGRPDVQLQIQEIQFLDQVIERKNFSWMQLLEQIEIVIPRDVHLTSLVPQVRQQDAVYVAMEARGRNIDSLSEFIARMEESAAFRNVAVSLEERDMVEGVAEVRLVMGAEYLPAALALASVAP